MLLLPSLVADGRADRHLVYADDDDDGADDDGAEDHGTDPAGADYYDDADDFTAAPLGRRQRLVQTRTPRQDFFKIFTCDCYV